MYAIAGIGFGAPGFIVRRGKRDRAEVRQPQLVAIVVQPFGELRHARVQFAAGYQYDSVNLSGYGVSTELVNFRSFPSSEKSEGVW